ncbi:MAG TPA: hypothetical protein VIH52_03990 [Candidatus Nanoarchaeia archaeon]|nr:hypothetical protein [uncultured archaeon]
MAASLLVKSEEVILNLDGQETVVFGFRGQTPGWIGTLQQLLDGKTLYTWKGSEALRLSRRVGRFFADVNLQYGTKFLLHKFEESGKLYTRMASR